MTEPPRQPHEVALALDTWAETRLRWEDLERMGRGETRRHLIALREALTYLDADIWHSALLARLLNGQEPLPYPPPLQNSYPAYDFMEQLYANSMWLSPSEVRFLNGSHHGEAPHPCVSIGRHSGIVLGILSEHVEHCDGQWLLSYREDCPQLLLEGRVGQDGEWHYWLRISPGVGGILPQVCHTESDTPAEGECIGGFAYAPDSKPLPEE